MFIAALLAIHERICLYHRGSSLVDGGPAEDMRALVRHIFQAILDYREFIGLLNSAKLHKARHIRASLRIPEMYGPPLDVMRTVLDRGQAESVFRPDIEPIDLYVSIGALGYDYVLDQSTLNAIVAVDLMTPPAIDRRLMHNTDIVMAYRLAVPASRAVSRQGPRAATGPKLTRVDAGTLTPAVVDERSRDGVISRGHGDDGLAAVGGHVGVARAILHRPAQKKRLNFYLQPGSIEHA